MVSANRSFGQTFVSHRAPGAITIIDGPARVLDLGSGDGRVGALLASKRPDLQIEGLDTLPRPSAAIPTTGYDGQSIPFPDRAFDFILLIDVLHHARSIEDVVSEARRVASRGLVIKDHTPSNAIDFSMLRMMDWAGNRGYGVDLPYARAVESSTALMDYPA